VTENPKPSPEPRLRSPDRLDVAGQLAGWGAALTVFGLSVLLFGASLREAAQPDLREQWARALGRDQPSLWPAGRTERVVTSHPAIRAELLWGARRLVPPLAERR